VTRDLYRGRFRGIKRTVGKRRTRDVLRPMMSRRSDKTRGRREATGNSANHPSSRYESSFERSRRERDLLVGMQLARYSRVTITKCYAGYADKTHARARDVYYFFVKGKFPLYSRTRASGFPSQGSRREYICVNFLADAIRRIPRAKRKPIARQSRSPSIFLASYRRRRRCRCRCRRRASSFSRENCAAGIERRASDEDSACKQLHNDLSRRA